MNASIIFPNQLFYPNPVLSKKRPTFLICDPLFFGDNKYSLNFHKQKLLLHLLSISEYKKELIKHGYDVSIIEDLDSNKDYFTDLFSKKNIGHLHFIDPNDFELEKRLNQSIKNCDLDYTLYDSPGFINSQSEIESYFFTKKKAVYGELLQRTKTKT